MNSINEYPNEFPHNNKWHIRMGFNLVELPDKLILVYEDPTTISRVRIELKKSQNQKMKRKTSPEKKTHTPKKPPTHDTNTLIKPSTNPVVDYINNTKNWTSTPSLNYLRDKTFLAGF